MMEYMSAKDAADKWQISQRRVAILCSENRIPNAEMLGNMWLIPRDAEKPADARSTKIKEDKKIKPFIKWAGGKSQLLNEINKRIPHGFGEEISKYVEPFVGGGAVLFDVLSRWNIREIFISDINKDLINCYKVIKDKPDELIELLQAMQDEYLEYDTEHRKEYYYFKRDLYNQLKFNSSESMCVPRTALFMFLNKTCFNGLYRVNSKGMFNVPMGAYKTPLICDTDNIKAVSQKLQNVTIKCGDFQESLDFVDASTFVYFDPPYRPLSKTAGFTSYNEEEFSDEQQERLAKYFKELDKKGAKLLLSNSDPKNLDENDDFFDKLYGEYFIDRVDATRMINSKESSRGKIKELLIYNYERVDANEA